MVYLIFLAAVVLVWLYFYIKSKRRTIEPFPEHWHALLEEHVLFYRNLLKKRQPEFRQRIMKFLAAGYIDGVETESTDLKKLLVACSAVIPVFGLKEWRYDNLSGVLL